MGQGVELEGATAAVLASGDEGGGREAVLGGLGGIWKRCEAGKAGAGVDHGLEARKEAPVVGEDAGKAAGDEDVVGAVVENGEGTGFDVGVV